MRTACLLGALVLAGCLAPPAATTPTAASPSAAKALLEPTEIGGANVTWIGSGSVDFIVEVPAGAADLAIVFWTATPAQNTVASHEATIRMDGCPEAKISGTGTGRFIERGQAWCDDPPLGKHQVTWTMGKGYEDGRVCVMARPKDADQVGSCRFTPPQP